MTKKPYNGIAVPEETNLADYRQMKRAKDAQDYRDSVKRLRTDISNLREKIGVKTGLAFNWILDNLDVILAIFVVSFVLIGIVLFVYAKISSYDEKITYNFSTWERVIKVQVFKTLHKDTYRSEKPTDAYNVEDYKHTYYVSKKCSYTTTSGYGANKVTTTYEYECGSYHTDYRSRYDVDRWVYSHNVVSRGNENQERIWPDWTPSDTTRPVMLGDQKEETRYETLTNTFQRLSGISINYTAPNYEDWYNKQQRVSWRVRFNRLEEVLWNTLEVWEK